MSVLGLELVSWHLEDKSCSRTLDCNSSGLTRAKFGRRSLFVSWKRNSWISCQCLTWDLVMRLQHLESSLFATEASVVELSLVAATVETTIFSINFFSCGYVCVWMCICPRMVPYFLRQTWNTIFSYPITWCSMLHRHSLGHFLGSLMNCAHLDSMRDSLDIGFQSAVQSPYKR